MEMIDRVYSKETINEVVGFLNNYIDKDETQSISSELMRERLNNK